jgi:hypothetical protein
VGETLFSIYRYTPELEELVLMLWAGVLGELSCGSPLEISISPSLEVLTTWLVFWDFLADRISSSLSWSLVLSPEILPSSPEISLSFS